MEALLLQLPAFLFGACIGSFINVVVYRLPLGLSIVHPPSRCPQCHTRLAPRDNLPIVGWLMLKGKCRYCRYPIAWRYPAVETLTACLFWAVAWRFGTEISPLSIVMLTAFVSWLLCLSLIDIDTESLPNVLTQSGLLLGIAYQALSASTSQELAQNLIFSTTGTILGVWSLSILGVVMTGFLGQEAMGGGDPKLLGLIGAWLGWQQVIITILISSLLGLLFAGTSTLIGKSRQKIRFGPFLAMGGLGALFYGKLLTEKYLLWFGIF